MEDSVLVTVVGGVVAGAAVASPGRYIDFIIDEDCESFYYTPTEEFADD
jgi:hypothetical protein